MPRIIDIVRERRNQIEGDPVEAERTGALAVAALMEGRTSGEWLEYLQHLGEFNPAQLARLRGQDTSAGDPEMDKKRVYVVANGMCGTNSPNTLTLPFRVNTIDEGLPEGCDPEP